MSEPRQVIEGFLVLEVPSRQHGIPAVYRGLYRLPPFFLDDWDSDPYMIEGLTNDAGFFATPEDAEAARGVFVTIRPGSYEIVFATTDLSGASTDDLGYDVACLAPFWSILADRSSDPPVDLNAHGLFPTAAAAHAYLRQQRQQDDQLGDLVLYVWRVTAIG